MGECHLFTDTTIRALKRDAIKKKKDANTVVFLSKINGVGFIIFEAVVEIPSPIKRFFSVVRAVNTKHLPLMVHHLLQS